jgi:hypothetical protein
MRRVTTSADSPFTNAACDEAARANWYVPVARLLGRSSRFATDEAKHLIEVAKDMLVGAKLPEDGSSRDVRAGPSVAMLVEQLAGLVARSDCSSLEADQNFWCLVRELYSRRPWVPRKARDLVDTVGIEVRERTASASTGAHTATDSTAQSDGAEGTAT